MAKEELEKESDEYADKHAFRVPYDGSNKFYDDVDFKASKEGYLAGAEPREKRIKVLEKKNKTAKRIIKGLLIILRETANDEYDFEKARPCQYEEAERFIKE